MRCAAAYAAMPDLIPERAQRRAAAQRVSVPRGGVAGSMSARAHLMARGVYARKGAERLPHAGCREQQARSSDVQRCRAAGSRVMPVRRGADFEAAAAYRRECQQAMRSSGHVSAACRRFEAMISRHALMQRHAAALSRHAGRAARSLLRYAGVVAHAKR